MTGMMTEITTYITEDEEIQAVHTKYNTNAGQQEHSVIKKAIYFVTIS